MPEMHPETAVQERYGAAAREREAALCCPVDYDPQYLKAIPAEVIEKDYGCGDPSRHLKSGETVLDLGSGTGKICFIASQVVGPKGRVIGVDALDDMLEVARRNAPLVAETIGHSNVEFRKGRIQDLGLDLDLLESHLKAQPVEKASQWMDLEKKIQTLRRTQPLIADASVDVVVSNCVLNLVENESKAQLFREIFRVLKEGGRAVISDIVSDTDVPLPLQQDPELWSGCISGAYREDAFLKAFEEAGFVGVRILSRDAQPWQIVEGIEFRSMTVEAHKPATGPCLDQLHAVIYKGPFKSVTDDDQHTLERGLRYAVCGRTFDLYSRPPYAGHFELLEPRVAVPVDEAPVFDAPNCMRIRTPDESKNGETPVQENGSSCCSPSSGCC